MSKNKNKNSDKVAEKIVESVPEVLMEPVVSPVVESVATARDVVGIRNLTRRVIVLPAADGTGIHLGPKEQVEVPKSSLSPAVHLFEAQGRVRITL